MTYRESVVGECPECSQRVLYGDSFCSSCGTNLDGADIFRGESQ